jgi:hypothetical protein
VTQPPSVKDGGIISELEEVPHAVEENVGLLLLCWTAGVSKPRADPLLFKDTHFAVSSDGTHLDLFSNPGVILQPTERSFPLSFLFGAVVPVASGASVTDTRPLSNPCASSSACSSGDGRTMRHPIFSTSAIRWNPSARR